MDMTQHWHGAQWVLATYFAISTFIPIVLRLSTVDKMKDPESWPRWWGGEIGRWMGRWTLIFVLYWGGFWT